MNCLIDLTDCMCLLWKGEGRGLCVICLQCYVSSTHVGSEAQSNGIYTPQVHSNFVKVGDCPGSLHQEEGMRSVAMGLLRNQMCLSLCLAWQRCSHWMISADILAKLLSYICHVERQNLLLPFSCPIWWSWLRDTKSVESNV